MDLFFFILLYTESTSHLSSVTAAAPADVPGKGRDWQIWFN